MNDLDLRTALHRDAELVGEPSPDLLGQLRHRRRQQQRTRAALAGVCAAVALVVAAVPVGASLMSTSDSGPATQRVEPVPAPPEQPMPSTTPTATPPAPPPAPETAGPTETRPVPAPEPDPEPAAPPPVAVAPCPDEATIQAALPPLDGGYTFSLAGVPAPLCSGEWVVAYPELLYRGGPPPEGEGANPALLQFVDGAWTWVYGEQRCADGILPADVAQAICGSF